MTGLPLRSIFISDFRRLEGHRTLPLDAPVVLVHGPNGAGKTSVLSALELALTGEVRSMRRHDPRYTAHLPYHGQDFATVRVDIGDELAANNEPVTMTVAGSRIEGAPALSREAAQFYTERCYLDQVSLGQLLELYQYREGKEESALARFVNELLGLEQLDALRTGLSDATDFRRLKKLCEPIAEAEAEAQRASADLTRATKELESAREVMVGSRTALIDSMEALGLGEPETEDGDLLVRAADLLRSQPSEDRATPELQRSLTALGGRIGALSNRPSVQRLEEARAAADAAATGFEGWSADHAPAIEAWRASAAALELDVSGQAADALDVELQRLDTSFTRQGELLESATRLEQRVSEGLARLQAVEDQLSGAQERAGSLAEGLAALREHAGDNLCPVCDRDFGEVSSTHLGDHIDRKIAELTTQGVQLRDLRQQRDALASEQQRSDQELAKTRAELWSATQREAANSRRVNLEGLREQLRNLQPAIVAGRELQEERDDAKAKLEELEATARDVDAARADLDNLARDLGAPVSEPTETLSSAWRRIADVAGDLIQRSSARHEAYTTATQHLDRAIESSDHVEALTDTVAEAAERRVVWEGRVQEARRRQGVARAVHDASSKARSAIVQRVFTESLNEVWRSVFTRLAPGEPFVPAFGIPSSSKTALELTLETVHTSGEPGGPPQMMLSAGNLNTAALSLFIALHLAVEPLVPCLVLDDPVQSMDEVHVAQFAGLIRVLSKHHKRQVVIAVHERELFQYLALELSPAFQGDELITIELGPRSEDGDRGITRHTWTPDSAIAV
jgi:exonuclease SbcC